MGDELSSVCKDVDDLLDGMLLPNAAGAESKVFFLKMKGDYLRYLAELKTGDDKESVTIKAEAAYKLAIDASKGLSPTHPIRLGLALNYSVFQYEVMGNHEA